MRPAGVTQFGKFNLDNRVNEQHKLLSEMHTHAGDVSNTYRRTDTVSAGMPG